MKKKCLFLIAMSLFFIFSVQAQQKEIQVLKDFEKTNPDNPSRVKVLVSKAMFEYISETYGLVDLDPIPDIYSSLEYYAIGVLSRTVGFDVQAIKSRFVKSLEDNGFFPYVEINNVAYYSNPSNNEIIIIQLSKRKFTTIGFRANIELKNTSSYLKCIREYLKKID